MDAIIMLSITSLLASLKDTYPQFTFKPTDDFSWSAAEHTVYYNTSVKNAWVFLLHELAHGLLGHADYTRDIELLAMERQAWERAKTLAADYNLTIDDEVSESTLDSYRDWLHARSTCPNCTATGLQIKKHTYSCPACGTTWQVNEARTCALRRYSA
jgi:hypothetical protein